MSKPNKIPSPFTKLSVVVEHFIQNHGLEGKIRERSLQSHWKEIVGVVKVIKIAFADPTDKDKKFVAVKVKFKEKLKNTVSLTDIKKNKSLKHLSLIKQSRLSVMPVDSKSWKIIYKMGKV